jgi:hypothetical protein
MRQRNLVRTMMAWALALALAGCAMDNTTMPNPPPGRVADRSAGLVAPVPDPIAHTLEDRQECFDCHAIGAVDASPVPDDSDHDEDVTRCTVCHAVWLVPAVAATTSPAIPHDVEGNENCLTCHKLGTANAPRIPDHHAGLADNICQTCHTTVGELVTAPEEGGEGQAAVPVEGVLPHPHPEKGYSACSLCHERGAPGVPKFPDDHVGRTDDLCTACHRPASEAP